MTTENLKDSLNQKQTTAEATPYDRSVGSQKRRRLSHEDGGITSEPQPARASVRKFDATSRESPPYAERQDSDEDHENGGDSAITIARRVRPDNSKFPTVYFHSMKLSITDCLQIHRLESQHMDDDAVDAIPGFGISRAQTVRGTQAHASKTVTSAYLKNALPSGAIMDTLLEEYFQSIHWFSLVVL